MSRVIKMHENTCFSQHSYVFPISFYMQKLSLQRENYDFCDSQDAMLKEFSGLDQGNQCFFGFSYLVSDKSSQNISETKGFGISCFPGTQNVPGALGKSCFHVSLFRFAWSCTETVRNHGVLVFSILF